MSEGSNKEKLSKPLTSEEVDKLLSGLADGAPAPVSVEAPPVVNESEDKEFARLAEDFRKQNLSQADTNRFHELARQRAQKEGGANVAQTPLTEVPVVKPLAVNESMEEINPSVLDGQSVQVVESSPALPVTPLTESERNKGLYEQNDAAAEYAGGRAKRPGGVDPTDYNKIGEKNIFSKLAPNEAGDNTPPMEEKPFILGSESERGPKKGLTEFGAEARETSERQLKQRLFTYRIWSGESDAKEIPTDGKIPENIEAGGENLFKFRGDLLDAYEKEYRACAVLKKLEKVRGGERGAGATEREKIWKENELLDARNKRKKAEEAYEKQLELFKRDLFNDFIKTKKEAFPDLTKKDLENEALEFQSRFMLETIKDLDQDTERLKMERAQNAQERGILRSWYEKHYVQAPRWKRYAIGAGIAAGVGAGLAFFAPGASIASVAFYGGSRALRSFTGGAFGGGLQALSEKLIIGRKYGKERGKVSEEEKQKTLENLKKELKDAENWLEDEEKKLKLMAIIDKDAKGYRARLDDITRREGKVRGWSALATGLIGGGLAYYGPDIWNSLRGIPKGSILGSVNHDDFHPYPAMPAEGVVAIEPSSVEIAQEMGNVPGSESAVMEPSSVETAQEMGNVPGVIEPSSVEMAQDMENIGAAIEPSSVETAQEMGIIANLDAKLFGQVYTVQEGDSLWKITRQMVKDGIITEDQWRDGWQNSTVEIMRGGETLKVPMHEVGLIHAGDQVRILDEAGALRFGVEDYPHDTLKLSDNQGYYDYLKNAGKTPPQWLEDAVAMKSGAKSALEQNAAEIHEISLASVSETAGEVVRGEPLLFPEALCTEIFEEFSGVSLARQEEILAEVASQRATIGDLGSSAWENPALVRDYARSFTEALGFENTLINSDAYLANIEAFSALLRDNEIFPSYFNRVKDVRVGEFIALAKGETSFSNSPFGYLQNQFRLYPDKWQKIASFLEQYQPGRPEKMLTLGKFVKGLIGG